MYSKKSMLGLMSENSLLDALAAVGESLAGMTEAMMAGEELTDLGLAVFRDHSESFEDIEYELFNRLRRIDDQDYGQVARRLDLSDEE